jgi:hypothetical protein
MLGDITTTAIYGFRDRVKRSRCGAPDLAPPASIRSRRGDEAPIHARQIARPAGFAHPFRNREPERRLAD